MLQLNILRLKRGIFVMGIAVSLQMVGAPVCGWKFEPADNVTVHII